MDADNHLHSIDLCLRSLLNTDNAYPMAKYMRHQFPFLGIPTPQRRAAIKQLNLPYLTTCTLLPLVNGLWQLPEREFQYVAIDLLKNHVKHLSPDALTPIKALVEHKSWWDSVDGLASVISLLLRQQAPNNRHIAMDTWLLDNNLWVRRVAMIHQLGWKDTTDSDRLAHYALTLAPETDFFIRKAIGWALRDYARWQGDWVAGFVHQHKATLSNLSAREAIKHLTQKEKRAKTIP